MPDPLHTQGDSPTRFVDNREGAATPFTPTDGVNTTSIGASEAAAFLQPSTVIADRFEIINLLGRGGMGVVYKVHDRLSRQQVALKLILPSVLSIPGAADRFIREVNTARQLRHESITAVYDFLQSGSMLFFTMEYLEGKTLRQVLNEQRRFSLAETVRILDQLCLALNYAHRYTVHRDLSPENVMLLDDGGVKLLDFGIARTLDGTRHTATGAAIGKAYYMAPEQRADASKVDARADIWSLGVMFFEMLSGELPLGYQRLTELVPGLPGSCEDLVARSLAPLDRRYESMGKFHVALKQCNKQAGPKVASPVPVVIVHRDFASSPATDRHAGEVATIAGIEFVWCPPGTFLMGSPDSDPDANDHEKPQHEVTITRGFWLGKYAVTQQQWQQVMGTNPSKFKGEHHPVESISWEDCVTFIGRKHAQEGEQFRLPSEAEWEYACRAGSTSRYCFGDSETHLGDYSWYGENSYAQTHRVGLKKSNAWNLHDMHGNVEEWCQDLYADYVAECQEDPIAESAFDERVLRGGSWLGDSVDCRAAGRNYRPPSARNYSYGFRLLRAED